MRVINHVFFDWDQVLTTESGSKTVSNNIAKMVDGASFEKVLAIYRNHIEQLNTGKITFKDVWDSITKECDLVGMSAEVMRAVLQKAPLNAQMFELAHSLKKHQRLGIITDNCRERMLELERKLNLKDTFDPIVTSASVGATKNDGSRTIFERALELAGAAAANSVFIDDRKENLVTPKQMGMWTYHFEPLESDIGMLRTRLQDWGATIEEE